MKRNPIINCLSLLTATAALLCAVAPAQAQTKKPNVVVIFCDDMGWGDPGAVGGGETRGAPTPNIDRMIAEGARFTQWYGQASCIVVTLSDRWQLHRS